MQILKYCACAQNGGENNMNKKELGDIFKALTLFFILTVVSLVMVFAKFEQGVKDFWQNEEIPTIVEEERNDEQKSK